MYCGENVKKMTRADIIYNVSPNQHLEIHCKNAGIQKQNKNVGQNRYSTVYPWRRRNRQKHRGTEGQQANVIGNLCVHMSIQFTVLPSLDWDHERNLASHRLESQVPRAQLLGRERLLSLRGTQAQKCVGGRVRPKKSDCTNK